MARKGRKRVWRGVRRGVLFVGLGFITSAVVAWALVLVPIAMWGNNWSERDAITTEYVYSTRMDFRRPGCDLYLVHQTGMQPEFLGSPVSYERSRGALPVRPKTIRGIGFPSWIENVLGDGLQFREEVAVSQAGWPMRCFGCCWKRYYRISIDSQTATIRFPIAPRIIGGHEIPIPKRGATQLQWFVIRHPPLASALPAIPLFPGFIVNTLFYAALWLGIVTGWRALKRKWRMHRGRCPMCRYDLARDFSTGCPECGWRRETTPRPVSF